MNAKRRRVVLIRLGIILGLVVALWINAQARWTVSGKVVDAETGATVAGAVVAIDWWEAAFGPPGFPASKDLEVAEAVTDAQGHFRVPKYSLFGLGREFNMVAYKKGYVCWSSNKIFPSYEKREDFDLESGMKIRLEPFKSYYSQEEHAMFVSNMATIIGIRILADAIQSEEALAAHIIQRSWRK